MRRRRDLSRGCRFLSGWLRCPLVRCLLGSWANLGKLLAVELPGGWIRGVNPAAGNRRGRHQRIAEKPGPEHLAGFGVEREDRAGLGIEDNDAVLDDGRGRAVVV